MDQKRFRMPFSGYSVKFSPFSPTVLSVASSQYYGIAGNGRVSLLNLQNGHLLTEFTTRDGCFDVSFSEASDRIIAAACGDGLVRLFDVTILGDRPAAVLSGHSAEIYSVDFNIFENNLLCSASWDKSARIFDTLTGNTLYKSSHSGIAYEAKFSPRSPSIMASVGGDGKLLLHDSKAGKIVQTVSAHGAEILSVDFNKYKDTIVATGGVDRLIKIFDLRFPSTDPVNVFDSHQLAVRRVKFSPQSDSLLCSCSYDTCVKLWSLTCATSLLSSYDHHTEFAIGIDFSNHQRDLVASTGWDRQIALWTLGSSSSEDRKKSSCPKIFQRL